MRNTDIAYELSEDYSKLFDFVMSGINVIGFITIRLENGKEYIGYSKLVEINHNLKYGDFNFGSVTAHKSVVTDRKDFEQLCTNLKVRYIEPNKIHQGHGVER